MNQSQKLAQRYDPVAERERRETYLASRRVRMPRYVEHMEALKDGVDMGTFLTRVLDRPYVRSRTVDVWNRDEPGTPREADHVADGDRDSATRAVLVVGPGRDRTEET